MAAELRGAAVTMGGSGTATGGTLVIPASVVANDYLEIAITSRNHTSGDGYPTVTDNDTGGNAWTRMTGAESSDRKATVWWKRATSGTASKTITVAGGINSTSAVLKCFSGVVTTGDPFTDVAVETNASGDETHAGFTPSEANEMLCALVFNYGNDNSVTNLNFATAGATSIAQGLSTAGSDCATAFGHVVQVGGPTGTGNLTWAQTNGTTYSIVHALKAIPDAPTGPWADEVAADSPTFWWKADETSGTSSLVDSEGGANGTLIGSPTQEVAGPIAGGSKAVTFDGSTQYATFPDAAGVDTGDTFTIELIMKRDSIAAGTPKILSKGANSYYVALNNSFVEVARQGVAVITTSTVQINSAGTWYHIVWTKDGTSTTSLYINGVNRTGTITAVAIADSATDLNIARSSGGGELFPGTIDEVLVYAGTALSASRVLKHYEAISVEPETVDFSGWGIPI